MKIKMKIISGFSIVSLLILILTFISYDYQKKALQNFHHIGAELLPGTIAIIKVEASLYKALQAAYSYGETGNLNTRKQLEEDLADIAEYQVAHKLYHDYNLTTEAKIDEALSEFSRHISQYVLLKDKNAHSSQLLKHKLKIDSIISKFRAQIAPEKDIRIATETVKNTLKSHDKIINSM